MASSLAAWAQNSILKGAGEGGIRGYRPHPPGTVLPGVPQALKGLYSLGTFTHLANLYGLEF